MKSSAQSGGRADFYAAMDQTDREHCRLDLDKVIDRQMTADAFITKWRDALRVILITRL